MNEYNNSAAGNAIQFFSLYNLATNIKEAWADWTVLPLAKLFTLQAINKASQAIGNAEFLSVTGGASTTVMSPTAQQFTAARRSPGGWQDLVLPWQLEWMYSFRLAVPIRRSTQLVRQIFRWRRRCFDRRNGRVWMSGKRRANA